VHSPGGTVIAGRGDAGEAAPAGIGPAIAEADVAAIGVDKGPGIAGVDEVRVQAAQAMTRATPASNQQR